MLEMNRNQILILKKIQTSFLLVSSYPLGLSATEIKSISVRHIGHLRQYVLIRDCVTSFSAHGTQRHLCAHGTMSVFGLLVIHMLHISSFSLALLFFLRVVSKIFPTVSHLYKIPVASLKST